MTNNFAMESSATAWLNEKNLPIFSVLMNFIALSTSAEIGMSEKGSISFSRALLSLVGVCTDHIRQRLVEGGHVFVNISCPMVCIERF